MAQQLSEPLEVAIRIDNGLGAGAEFSRIKTAAIEVLRVLAAWTCRRGCPPAESFLPHKSQEDACLEFDRFLFW